MAIMKHVLSNLKKLLLDSEPMINIQKYALISSSKLISSGFSLYISIYTEYALTNAIRTLDIKYNYSKRKFL